MLVIRRAGADDIDAMLRLQVESYPVLSTVAQWRREHLEGHQRRFPDGQIVAADKRRVVGYSASFRTKSAVALKPHTFREITVRGTFDGHDPEGDTLYGAEIMVHPDYRRQGLSRRIYDYRFALVRRLGLRYFVAGGRIPGYGAMKDSLGAEAYVHEVEAGRRVDRVLTPQLRSGLRPVAVLTDYLLDPKSANFAALLVWENPDWKNQGGATKKRSSAGAKPRRAKG